MVHMSLRINRDRRKPQITGVVVCDINDLRTLLNPTLNDNGRRQAESRGLAA
jgi:hypothetical protein